jgi:serine acetyltransferase
MSKYWTFVWQINFVLKVSRFLYYKIPFIGKLLSYTLDRLIFIIYGIELMSFSVNVKHLSIAHPSGVLLGGNGIYSNGRVVIMSGVKFGGKTPNDPQYKELHKVSKVFKLGDNVVIGSNTCVLGPVEICDNVIIGSMSLVNKSITEPGTYVGIPVKRVSEYANEDWIKHL